jgi:hypothetical protein
VKFFIDGDKEFPTICGTGTEDYFCGSYDFEGEGKDGKTRYTEFTTPYSGMPQVIRPDGLYDSQERFSLYRWHITDPVRFENGLKVTIQDLGWQSGRALPARLRTTSPRWPSGTRPAPMRNTRPSPRGTSWSCTRGDPPRARQGAA